jgi:RNA exonuclease 4
MALFVRRPKNLEDFQIKRAYPKCLVMKPQKSRLGRIPWQIFRKRSPEMEKLMKAYLKRSFSIPFYLSPCYLYIYWCGYRTEVGRYVAIDCEMIGVGPNPDKESALARVSIVNWNGDQVYDSFVRPKEKVTDWRTRVSGVSAKDMAHARSLEEVQRHVADIIEDTVLIGHAIKHDLNALLLSHPKCDIRDTSRHPPYRKFAGGSSPRLKVLAAELLGLSIQEGAHSSVEDARVTMLLFRRDKEAFDREHAKKWPVRVMVEGQKKVHNGAKKKKKKKKSRKRWYPM